MPLGSTVWADVIFKSDIPTSHLAATSMHFAIIVTAICPVLAMMLLGIGVESIQLKVDIFGGISKDIGKLLVRQQLMPI